MPKHTGERCTQTGRLFNPEVYKADYFGHNMLVYQNMKSVMYSAAHVGHAAEMITGYAIMRTESNITICEKIFW